MLSPAVALVAAGLLALGGTSPAPSQKGRAVSDVDDVANPRPGGGWVSDVANLLRPEAERQINARLDALERDLGTEIAVVTVPDVRGTPKDFATALFNHWGIGKRALANGVLVLIVRQRRRVEIETGYGLEASLPDAWLGQMQVTEMVPRLRRQDYAGGIVAALTAIEERLRAGASTSGSSAASASQELLPAVAVPPVAQAARPQVFPTAPLALAGLAAAAVLSIALLIRRRRRTCRACHVPMARLTGVTEQAHLDEGQRVETKLGSVRHSVYRCQHCQEVRHFRWVRWFSGVASCDRCRCRARVTRRETVQLATVFHGGIVQIESKCAHCGDVRIERVHTPATPLPAVHSSATSSFSDGGSSGLSGGGSSVGSFGGGDSGGGGAGSSY
jgi:uncharacterized protein